MKLRFKYEVGRWIIGRWYGKVLYPFVLFKQKKDKVTDQLFRHELEHVYQVRRMGWLCFYLRYIWLWMQHGYRDHPFELEARERQDDPLTDEEKELRA